MVKFSDENERSQSETKILTALAFMEEVIANKCQLKLKANLEAHPTAEKAISEAQDTNKIRELYRVICEIPGKPCEIELRKSEKSKPNGNFWKKVRNRIARIELIN